MKTNILNAFNFGVGGAQTRPEAVNLRNKAQTITTMKRCRIIALLGLLGLAGPPLLRAQITESYTFTTNRVVPDGKASGLSEVRSVSSAIANIASVKVRLKIDGEFNGDLYAYLRHVQNGVTNFCVLLNRPGKTAADSAGYADAGFEVTFQTGAPNGDIHVYRNVTTPTSPLTGIWEPDGRTDDPGIVTDGSARPTSLTSFNTVSASGEWSLFVADLESGGTNMLREWGLEFTGGVQPTIAWSNPADITYGTALGAAQLNATATFDSTNVPGSFAYTPAAGTILSAGDGQTLSVTFTPTDAATYLTAAKDVTINVKPAALTIAANSATKAYGETVTFAGTEFTATGLVNSDTVTSITLNSDGAVATAAVTGSPYAITPSAAAGTGLSNYAITYANGTLTVSQAGTAGAIASSANPVATGTAVTFTMTVTPVAPGAGQPDGTVNFLIDGTSAGSGTLSGGVATFTTSTLAHGTHTVAAEYAGSANFSGSTATLAPVLNVNSAPVAGNDTIERYPTQGVKVRLSTLLANDSDADSDTLTASVASTSANSGTVTVSGGWVFYTPASSFTGVDSFTYNLSDGHDGTATGTVTVNIKVDDASGQNLTIADLGNGSFRITGSGIPARSYRLGPKTVPRRPVGTICRAAPLPPTATASSYSPTAQARRLVCIAPSTHKADG